MKHRHQDKEVKRPGCIGACIHSVSGRTCAPKMCILNYECYHCPFDQWLDLLDKDVSKKARAADDYPEAV